MHVQYINGRIDKISMDGSGGSENVPRRGGRASLRPGGGAAQPRSAGGLPADQTPGERSADTRLPPDHPHGGTHRRRSSPADAGTHDPDGRRADRDGSAADPARPRGKDRYRLRRNGNLRRPAQSVPAVAGRTSGHRPRTARRAAESDVAENVGRTPDRPCCCPKPLTRKRLRRRAPAHRAADRRTTRRLSWDGVRIRSPSRIWPARPSSPIPPVTDRQCSTPSWTPAARPGTPRTR